MSAPPNEISPSVRAEADSKVIAATGLILSQPCPLRPVLTRPEVYEIIRGRLVAHVIVKDAAGKVTTRPYRNIGAADRAMRRARERGCASTVVMVRQDVAPLIGGEER